VNFIVTPFKGLNWIVSLLLSRSLPRNKRFQEIEIFIRIEKSEFRSQNQSGLLGKWHIILDIEKQIAIIFDSE